LIEQGEPRPTDIHEDYWKEMKEIRSTPESQQKSEKMAAIARGHGSKNTSKKSMERTLLSKMVRN